MFRIRWKAIVLATSLLSDPETVWVFEQRESGRWIVRQEGARNRHDRGLMVKFYCWFYKNIFIVKYSLSGSIDRWSKVKQFTIPEDPPQRQLDPLRGCEGMSVIIKGSPLRPGSRRLVCKCLPCKGSGNVL